MRPIRWRAFRLTPHTLAIQGSVGAFLCRRTVVLPLTGRERRLVQHSIRELLREAELSP